ncbi:MAG TPA: MFS transporter [Pseudonocardiaceae bacterium]|nr:MFS transporter [Pseudonocardiaceae bacterium]
MLARVADEMVGVSVVLLVLGRTGSAALAGAAVAGYTLPAVLTGPLLGAWLAGARRPKLALAGNELVLATVAVGLLLAVGHAPSVAVVALTLLAGVSLPLTSGGFSSLLPGLVGRSGLARANTVDATTVNGAAVAGPALAGTLAATLGPGTAVGAIGVVAVLAAAATAGVPGHKVPAGGERPALLRVARAGLAHLAGTPPLRAATLTSVVSLGSVGMLVVALPARVVELGAKPAAAGYLWTAFELGSLFSILVVAPRLRRFRPEAVVFCAVGGYGLLLSGLALTPTLALTIVVAVLAGMAEGPNLPSVFAARQRYSPDELLAQVSTTGASMKIGAFAIGSLLSGLLTGPLGPTGMLLLAAAGQLIAVVAGWAVGLTASAGPRHAPDGSQP